ncbi:hypothetical protein A7O47_02430, partial [Listeria monocytogenes]
MTRDKEFDVSTYSVVEYVGDLNKESYYDAASNANKIAEKYKPGKEHQVLEVIINCPENSLLDLD